MATNAPVRKRVVVKSKRPARSSDSSITDAPPDFVDRPKQSAGYPSTSTPEPVVGGEGVTQTGLTSGRRQREVSDEVALPLVLQHPGSVSLPSPRPPPHGSRKKQDTTSSSSDNEGDEVFVNHPRQVFFVTPGNQLSPPSHYNQSFLEPAGRRKYSKERHSQVAPMILSRTESYERTPSPHYHANPNTLLSSGSPHDEFSTVSSFSTSSPLPLLLTANMRRGGAPYHDNTSLLESILPGRVLKVFVGTWNMCGQKASTVDKC